MKYKVQNSQNVLELGEIWGKRRSGRDYFAGRGARITSSPLSHAVPLLNHLSNSVPGCPPSSAAEKYMSEKRVWRAQQSWLAVKTWDYEDVIKVSKFNLMTGTCCNEKKKHITPANAGALTVTVMVFQISHCRWNNCIIMWFIFSVIFCSNSTSVSLRLKIP